MRGGTRGIGDGRDGATRLPAADVRPWAGECAGVESGACRPPLFSLFCHVFMVKCIPQSVGCFHSRTTHALFSPL